LDLKISRKREEAILMQATLVEVKGGWHAVGDGWAVFGQSKQEALARYEEAERQHAEILARDSGDVVERVMSPYNDRTDRNEPATIAP
jgi:hypothetical protein